MFQKYSPKPLVQVKKNLVVRHAMKKPVKSASSAAKTVNTKRDNKNKSFLSLILFILFRLSCERLGIGEHRKLFDSFAHPAIIIILFLIQCTYRALFKILDSCFRQYPVTCFPSLMKTSAMFFITNKSKLSVSSINHSAN